MNDNILSLVAVVVIGPIIALWPYIFIRLKKGVNQILFVSAFYGMLVVANLLLLAIALPAAFFSIKLFPTLQFMGFANNLETLMEIFELISDWYWLLIFPLLFFALPPLLYQRYEVFRLTKTGS